MKKSIFFNDTRKNKIQVSYLFLEILAAIAEANPNDPVEVALVATCIRLGHAEGTVKKEELMGLTERLAEIKNKEQVESEKAPAKPSAKSNKKTFGEDYTKHMTKLGPAEKCLLVSGFDVEKARHLYCTVDKEIADAAIATYFETRWQELKTGFEACVFGFGGSLDGPASDADHDMTTPEGLRSATEAMRAMRF